MDEAVQPVADDYVVDPKRDRLVIVASSLGTVFEWYDFFIYGTLAPVIAGAFLPVGQSDRRAPAHSGHLRRRASACGRSARSCSAFSATNSGANIPSSSPSP